MRLSTEGEAPWEIKALVSELELSTTALLEKELLTTRRERASLERMTSLRLRVVRVISVVIPGLQFGI